MSSVSFDNVSVAFNVRKNARGGLAAKRDTLFALKGVTFELKSGDHAGILGKNGAGKTTLLRVLSKMLPPTDGVLKVVGQVHGAMSLSSGLLAQASVLDNIRMRAYYNGLKGQEAKEFVSHVRSLADLEDFVFQPVAALSNGMRSRLMISMFHARECEIIAFDEWVGVLDRTQFSGETALKKLIDSANISIIASHNTAFIRKYCSRALLVDKGQIKFDGDVEEAIRLHKSTLD